MSWEELGKSKVSIDQSNPGISNAVALTGSNIQLPIDLQSHNLSDMEAIPVRSILYETLILVDGLELRSDTVTQKHSTEAILAFTERIKTWKDFNLFVRNTHDQPIIVSFYSGYEPGPSIRLKDGTFKNYDIGYENTNLGHLCEIDCQDVAFGILDIADRSGNVKEVHETYNSIDEVYKLALLKLANVNNEIKIRIGAKRNTSPTTGAITIWAVGRP